MEAFPIIFSLWLKWHFLSLRNWVEGHASRPVRYLCNLPFKEGKERLLKTLQSKEIESGMTFSAAQIVLNRYSCLWTFVVFYIHLCPYIEISCLWFYYSTLTLEFCMFDISCDVPSDVGCFIDLYFCIIDDLSKFLLASLWTLHDYYYQQKLITLHCSSEQQSWKIWATLYWAASGWVLTTSRLSKIQTLVLIPFRSNVRLDAFGHVITSTMLNGSSHRMIPLWYGVFYAGSKC